ncbi:MAG TPA: hypothetical protein VF316_09115 [Polyangiaceae bacterium]
MRRLPGILAWLAVGVVAIPPTACTVRSDEFLCEDAVAKLRGCCSSAAIDAIGCTYDAETCAPPVYPQLNETESRCIIGASCAQLRSGGCVTGMCP